MYVDVFLNLSHYVFFEVGDGALAKKKLESILHGQDVRGTVLIAREGVNFNLCGLESFLKPAVTEWLRDLGCASFNYKASLTPQLAFRRLKIKVKREIITMGQPELRVAELRGAPMAPETFAELLNTPEREREAEWLILDTRNDFEVEQGTFRGAVPAQMKSFRDFKRVATGLRRDRKIAMFCTGGVRCEKASAYLRQEGFSEVYQLEGGILRYLEVVGWEHFEGECFVFDERVALNKDNFLAQPTGAEPGEGNDGHSRRRPP